MFRTKRVELHLERRNREWMASSILKVDPLAEFCITALGDTGPRYFTSELPRRIVFEKGTGASITDVLREMKIFPRRLHVYRSPVGYGVEIKQMNDVHSWLSGVIDHWTETMDDKSPWNPFESFSFVDRQGQLVRISPPDDHDDYWHSGGKYSGRFVRDCFEIWVENMTAQDNKKPGHSPE